MAAPNREENARRLFCSGSYVAAAEEYARLANENPKCAKWLTNQAKCLVNLNKHAAAIKLCQKSIKVDKTWSRGYEVAGQCLLSLQRDQEAEDVLLQGKQAAPSPEIERLLSAARVAIVTHRRCRTNVDVSRGPEDSRSDLETLEQEISSAFDDMYQRRLQTLSPAQVMEQLASDSQEMTKYEEGRDAMRRALALEKAGRNQDAAHVLESRATALNCTPCMATLARMLLLGDASVCNPPKGIYWARRCVDQGPSFQYKVLGKPDPDVTLAQSLLGLAYRQGLGGLESDRAQAEKWLRAAADTGDVVAMVSLASLLVERGTTEEINGRIEKASPKGKTGNDLVESNHLEGSSNSKGDSHLDGSSGNIKGANSSRTRESSGHAGANRPRGTTRPKRNKEVLSLYRRAADQGEVTAMANLGRHLMSTANEGDPGYARDVAEATGWFHKAAALGDLSAIGDLLGLVTYLPNKQVTLMLEAALSHARAQRSREEGPGGKGVQGHTLSVEATLCVDLQRARDRGMSEGEAVRALQGLPGGASPGIRDLLGAAEFTNASAEARQEVLMNHLAVLRPPTALEVEAGRLAEWAGALARASLSSPDARVTRENIGNALVAVGRLFQDKGLEGEAHARFLLPAAKLGHPQGCHLAGQYLAGRAASGRDLRAAQRFLSQAAARGVPGAQGEFDALTARLAGGGGPEGPDETSPGNGDGFNDGDRDMRKSINDDGSQGSAAFVGGGATSSGTSQGSGAGTALKTCWGCRARAANLRKCGQCRLAEYCSQECQKKHWKEGGHKKACAGLAC